MTELGMGMGGHEAPKAEDMSKAAIPSGLLDAISKDRFKDEDGWVYSICEEFLKAMDGVKSFEDFQSMFGLVEDAVEKSECYKMAAYSDHIEVEAYCAPIYRKLLLEIAKKHNFAK